MTPVDQSPLSTLCRQSERHVDGPRCAERTRFRGRTRTPRPVRFRGQCGLVKAAWFRALRAGTSCRRRFERIVQSWDTANKATELSDFSVCTTWGIAGKDLYLLDVLRRRMEYPELKRAVREQYERFGPSVVLIEDKASGIQLIQELIGEGLHAVTRYQPQTDKIMRMHAQTAMIENGFVRVPDAAPWLAPYLHELTVFPNGKHDDQVDTSLGRPRRCSTGSSEAAAPAPTPGSSSFTGSAPRRFAEGRRRALRRACAPHAASRAFSCSQASAGTWPPTARSRCRKRMPRRCCGRSTAPAPALWGRNCPHPIGVPRPGRRAGRLAAAAHRRQRRRPVECGRRWPWHRRGSP